jgi:hypothetical protein
LTIFFIDSSDLLFLFYFNCLIDELLLACGYENHVEDLKKVKEILSQHPSLLNESSDQYDNTPLQIASAIILFHC